MSSPGPGKIADPPGASSATLELCLYVAGDAPNSGVALVNLREIVAALGPGTKLSIVDVLQDPERGLRDGIIATPTLVRVWPKPERRILGDLRDRAQVLLVLGQ
jgi:circadian clock protein KaiB